MARIPAEDALARALAERTGTRPEDWFCVFKARYGMTPREYRGTP